VKNWYYQLGLYCQWELGHFLVEWDFPWVNLEDRGQIVVGFEGAQVLLGLEKQAGEQTQNVSSDLPQDETVVGVPSGELARCVSLYGDIVG
jgi:hypothetical protein